MTLADYSAKRTVQLGWTNSIPMHWTLKRGKFVFSRMKRPPRDEDGIVTAFRDGQVTLRANRRTVGFTNALKEIGYQGVRTGDLVIHAMDGFAGAIGVSDSDGKCSPVYSCCIPLNEASGSFYAFLCRNMATTGFIESLAKGIRERSTDFRWEDFGQLYLPLPPPDEQAQIATALDRETARIDALIEKKTRFIELLKEKRQALITQAVTKGLNPNAPMRDSGVEWLGEVPAHWEVKSFKYLAKICNGKDYKSVEIDEGGYPVYGSGGEFRRAKDYLYDGESVLLGRKGTIDKPLYVDEKFWTVDTMFFTRIEKMTSGRFLYYSALAIPFTYYQTNTALPSMTQEVLSDHRLVSPPVNEQREITLHLDKVSSRIDELIGLTTKSSELLKERRSALITAAVTGQIDLREAA